MELSAANDNHDRRVTVGSGNNFLDLGLDADEADRAVLAMVEYHKKGGTRFDDFKAELAAHVCLISDSEFNELERALTVPAIPTKSIRDGAALIERLYRGAIRKGEA